MDLNDLEMIAADIGNVYLHEQTRKNLYTTRIDTGGESSKSQIFSNK